jgi:ribosomal protein S18 acetylase RimI-like enzyme
MIGLNQEELIVVKNILYKYPYSFYAFGLGAKSITKKISELDLCVMSNVSTLEMLSINDDFKKSNLPFKVDVKRYFEDMNSNFRNLIHNEMRVIQTNPYYPKIESNVFSNFKHLPKTIDQKVMQYDDMTMISCGFNSVACNIVCDTHMRDKSYEDMVARADQFYQAKPYVWWLGSPSAPVNFAAYLALRGFVLASIETAMICDLSKIKDQTFASELKIEQANTLQHLRDFAHILTPFENNISSIYVNELLISTKFSKINPLFICYIDDKPVATVSLYIDNGIASLHDLVTSENFRNQGIATNMIKHMMKYTIEQGVEKICLTTSLNPEAPAGMNIYQRIGFDIVDKFECYLSSRNYR